ncbi:MAG: hypothetical protein Q8930_16025 [Bacillota bacterium]|nr:hypothetical protein [Bacillota bacterium]
MSKLTSTHRYEIADDPLPDIDGEYLIFAKHNDDGSYTPLSGSQGRYDYKDGSISSLNYTHSGVRTPSIDVHNKNFKDLKTKIQAHKKDKQVKVD